MIPLQINPKIQEERMKQFVDALARDKAERGFRPDIHVVGGYIDEENARFWLILSFSPNIGSPDVKDVLGLVYRFYPDFEIDWKRSYGIRTGSLYIALKPFVERIPVRDITEIPSGFVPKGTGIYSFKEPDGTESYWQFIKEGDRYYLVRKDGTKPPSVVPPVEIKERKGIQVGSLVKTKEGIGIVQGKTLRGYMVKLLGQTKVIEVTDVAEFDPLREKDILRQYYSNLYPPDFVDALLR